MKELSGYEIYKKIKKEHIKYNEELHSVMIIDAYLKTGEYFHFVRSIDISNNLL